ncbi:MAG: mechanosensitive ion channel family protein [Deltaproteobacteria bacterium]|nr:mechanosensitive ion channel family protein [Deltaproteobacteria bacterium]
MDQITQMLNSIPWVALLAGRLIKILLILGVVIATAKLIHLVCDRLLKHAERKSKAEGVRSGDHGRRLATVVQLVDTTLRVILFGAAALMVLKECGLDITPLLAGAGIAGVALGLGAQSLVKDIIAGFFLLLEDQLRVDDVIAVAGISGRVERMDLRTTSVRDMDGTLHMIPNGEIKVVSNMTYGYAMAVVRIPLPYHADVNAALAAIEKALHAFEKDPAWQPRLHGRAELQGITSFGQNTMEVRTAVRTNVGSRAEAERELRLRILKALDAAKVPFPGATA